MSNNQSFVEGSKQNYRNQSYNMYHPINQSIYNANYNMNLHPNYMYPISATSDDDSKNTITIITKEKRQADEQDINHFLEDIDQSKNINDQRKIKRKSKIATTKDAITSANKLNEKLKIICAELKDEQNLSEDEWQEKVNICETAKSEIMKLLEPIRDQNFVSQLKKDLERRKKKRLREKIKKAKWKHEKTVKMERRARLHAQIDSWIRKEQAVIEKEKQEENLRKDADMILSDVRMKRSDVRKYLGLLQDLKNLRSVKANIARARGEHLSSAADEAFNNIIAKLTEQWSTLDREYSIEEQGLKLMLKTDNEERIEKQKKNLFDEWENVLFGKKILMCDQYDTDLTNFITTRTAWDKHISTDRDASAIPVGWVMPDKPSSAAWQKYLKKEIS
ncbi:PREDICTED: programmed cell death protein 7-like [Dufourea novaeangliae]|uniref:Programmed cell death protein 7 n=1 Tax=Dufourea novaeangliae TaxID=178035 RepID=A0A154P234_DUFNO|nr:PREDICTED: programmed cell death protein 7-like [Dufourea novaeangliae]KZC05394.1 Programmed cell death protein 7 [Dufourea novaeangliae]